MNLQGDVEPIARAAAPIDPRVTIGHVHLRTTDIANPRAFYADHQVRQTADHGTHLAIYVTDFDANDVELVWDRPPAEWPRDAEGHVQMAMDAEVDLDALVAEAGGA